MARQRGGSPTALSTWRITTGDHAVADTLASSYGGIPHLWETNGGHSIEVLTRRDRVPVLLDGEASISLRMLMRGTGEAFHVCDGTRFLEPAAARGSVCGCPAGLADRKAAAKAGRGPTPEARLRFRLADLPELGAFSLTSTSWDFAEELPTLVGALNAADTPALCVLQYELVEFATLSGIDVSYRKPVVEVGRCASVAARSRTRPRADRAVPRPRDAQLQW
ncbi:hypothetical protein ACIHCQ_23225 [Streptomyces sp. NPDC052236]|uniref:recombination directionality factor n=1 Tax=Streptomyces sp. NPDC052236 TaxID=3365686 RepID=UPI0037CF1E8C